MPPTARDAQCTQPLAWSSASRLPVCVPRNSRLPAATGCERMSVTCGSASDQASSSCPMFAAVIATPSRRKRVLRSPKPQFCVPLTGISPGGCVQAWRAIQASRRASSGAASHCPSARRCCGVRAAACACILPNSIALSSRARGICCRLASVGERVAGFAWQVAQWRWYNASGATAAGAAGAAPAAAASASAARARNTRFMRPREQAPVVLRLWAPSRRVRKRAIPRLG